MAKTRGTVKKGHISKSRGHGGERRGEEEKWHERYRDPISNLPNSKFPVVQRGHVCEIASHEQFQLSCIHVLGRFE